MHIALSDRLLADPAYQERIRLRGYNCKRTVFGASTERDSANILIAVNRSWSRADHTRLAEEHRLAAELQDTEYQKALDGAAQQTFGRSWHIWDYQMCCVGREEFSDAWKEVLRYHGYAASKHRVLAAAHVVASKSRRIH